MKNTTAQNSTTNFTLSPVKGYECWDCSVVKNTEGKVIGFVIANDRHPGTFRAIYQPFGRVPRRSMLQIAERTTKEECAEIIINTHVNGAKRFMTI
jgi:hypothetical protein